MSVACRGEFGSEGAHGGSCARLGLSGVVLEAPGVISKSSRRGGDLRHPDGWCACHATCSGQPVHGSRLCFWARAQGSGASEHCSADLTPSRTIHSRSSTIGIHDDKDWYRRRLRRITAPHAVVEAHLWPTVVSRAWPRYRTSGEPPSFILVVVGNLNVSGRSWNTDFSDSRSSFFRFFQLHCCSQEFPISCHPGKKTSNYARPFRAYWRFGGYL